MKRITLVPALGMAAIIGLLLVADRIGPVESFRPAATLMFLSLPLLALGEVVAFAYDIRSYRGQMMSRALIPRLAVHILGITLVCWIILVIIRLPLLRLN
jgi:hypothetical protein